jgi:hypothetical protein
MNCLSRMMLVLSIREMCGRMKFLVLGVNICYSVCQLVLWLILNYYLDYHQEIEVNFNYYLYYHPDPDQGPYHLQCSPLDLFKFLASTLILTVKV